MHGTWKDPTRMTPHVAIMVSVSTSRSAFLNTKRLFRSDFCTPRCGQARISRTPLTAYRLRSSVCLVQGLSVHVCLMRDMWRVYIYISTYIGGPGAL